MNLREPRYGQAAVAGEGVDEARRSHVDLDHGADLGREHTTMQHSESRGACNERRDYAPAPGR